MSRPCIFLLVLLFSNSLNCSEPSRKQLRQKCNQARQQAVKKKAERDGSNIYLEIYGEDWDDYEKLLPHYQALVAKQRTAFQEANIIAKEARKLTPRINALEEQLEELNPKHAERKKD